MASSVQPLGLLQRATLAAPSVQPATPVPDSVMTVEFGNTVRRRLKLRSATYELCGVRGGRLEARHSERQQWGVRGRNLC